MKTIRSSPRGVERKSGLAFARSGDDDEYIFAPAPVKRRINRSRDENLYQMSDSEFRITIIKGNSSRGLYFKDARLVF
jgi:hypothetical protein